MGRYSEPLAALFVDWVGVHAGERALDVGSGPGALTTILVQRLGADHISAVDPSTPFVAAALNRLPGVDVRVAGAEDLPFATGTFDVVLAQLVVHFMTDPVAGITEMARVCRPGGTVAASVWDHAGGSGPLSVFWQAVQDLDPGVAGDAALRAAKRGELTSIFSSAGLTGVQEVPLTVRVRNETVQQWWEPYTLGVGPAGAYVAGLDAQQRAALLARCTQLLPAAPFEITATAWAARGRVG